MLERIYNIPLRKEFEKVPRYKKAARAIRAIKKFLAKHMKVEERDEKKVKIGKWLNHEIWKRGIRKPPHHIKVKAVKDDSGIVNVELFELPLEAIKEIEKEKKKTGEKAEEENKKAEEEKEKKKKEKLEEKKLEEEARREIKGEAAVEEKEKLEERKVFMKEKPRAEHELMKPKKELKAERRLVPEK